MNADRILFCLLAAFCLQACTQKHVFSEYREIPGLKWRSLDTLRYNFDISNTGNYSLALSARHRKDYEFSNLWFRVHVKGPAVDTAFRFEMALFNPEGRPYGESSGSTCTQTIPVKGISRLDKGHYTVSLVQLMRKDPIDGVQDVGVIVDIK